MEAKLKEPAPSRPESTTNSWSSAANEEDKEGKRARWAMVARVSSLHDEARTIGTRLCGMIRDATWSR